MGELLEKLGLPSLRTAPQAREPGVAPGFAMPGAAAGGSADTGSPMATKTQAQLIELARWPGDAHRAWKGLTSMDRVGLFNNMEAMYGKPFAKAFEQFTKGGTVLKQDHYVTALAYQTPQWFEGKGYKLAKRSTYQQWWVHANGHLIFLVLESTPEELKRALARILKSNAKADADSGIINALRNPLELGTAADPLATFNDYVAKLNLLQTFLEGELTWAAQTRKTFVKKGIGTTEFDELVAELASTKDWADALVRNEDRLDPTQDHITEPIDPKDIPPPIDFSGRGGP